MSNQRSDRHAEWMVSGGSCLTTASVSVCLAALWLARDGGRIVLATIAGCLAVVGCRFFFSDAYPKSRPLVH